MDRRDLIPCSDSDHMAAGGSGDMCALPRFVMRGADGRELSTAEIEAAVFVVDPTLRGAIGRLWGWDADQRHMVLIDEAPLFPHIRNR